MLACVCGPRTQEAKAGELQAESQPGLQSEATLKSQTKIPKAEAELTEAWLAQVAPLPMVMLYRQVICSLVTCRWIPGLTDSEP